MSKSIKSLIQRNNYYIEAYFKLEMFNDLLNLFFPLICQACRSQLSDNENQICTTCRHELPLTNFHFDDTEAVKKIFYGRIKLENATALLHFSKQGIVQELLHNLKYKEQEAIGGLFGNWIGHELKDIKDYALIDVVVPVPLHKYKLKKRGYNQVDKFGKAIAKCLDADYNTNVLIKNRNTATQVFKDRLTRFDDDNTKFAVQNENQLKGKHILLVDDIITTGATIELCANLLKEIDGTKISVVSMAIAD